MVVSLCSQAPGFDGPTSDGFGFGGFGDDGLGGLGSWSNKLNQSKTDFFGGFEFEGFDDACPGGAGSSLFIQYFQSNSESVDGFGLGFGFRNFDHGFKFQDFDHGFRFQDFDQGFRKFRFQDFEDGFEFQAFVDAGLGGLGSGSNKLNQSQTDFVGGFGFEGFDDASPGGAGSSLFIQYFQSNSESVDGLEFGDGWGVWASVNPWSGTT